MKTKTLLFVIILILTGISSLSPQSVTSKTTGGNWEDADTWVGGSVPGAGSNVVINGTVSVTSSSSSCAGLTINPGCALQNGGGLGWVTFTVKGDLTNNGTVRNNPSGNDLWVQVNGNIANNGTWNNRGVYLEGKKLQYISQSAGKKFECEFHKHASSGYTDTLSAIASTDLTFSNIFELNGTIPNAGGYGGTLDMAGHSLTLSGSSNIFYGTVKNASNVYCYEDSRISSVTYSGTTNLHGAARIFDSNVTFDGNVTVTDTLENGGGLGWVTLQVTGTLTNNGVIKNNSDGNELWIQANGNVVNNGLWNNRGLYLESKRTQYLSQGAGKMFDCEIHKSASSGYTDTLKAVALTDLTFNKKFELDGTLKGAGGYRGTLDMNGRALILKGSANVYYGTVRNASDLYCYDNSGASSVTYIGATNLYGAVKIYDSNVNFIGEFTVRDTLENGGGLGWVTLHVYGSIINSGIVKNNPAGNELWLEVKGNISGSGEYRNRRTYIYTDGSDRRVSGRFYDYIELKKTGSPEAGKIRSGGDIYNSGEFRVQSGTEFEIASGSTFYQRGVITNYGSITNNSQAVASNIIGASQQYGFFNLNTALLPDAKIDSMTVESYGNQVPAAFGNGVKSWWRIKPYPENIQTVFSSASFYYEEAQLGANDENTLQVFHSEDSGKTWKQLSTSLNTARYADKNYLTITDVPAFGDYILSSSGNPYSVKPSVIVSVTGRSQIRVGPPNRYTIFYVNNSDIPADDFIITLGTGYKTHIKQAEFYHDNGQKEIVPVDSIQFENEDTSAVFYVAGLQPHEERSFDVILNADPPDASGRMNKTAFEPFTMAATAVVVYIGCKTIDYIGDRARDKIDKWEVLTPEQKAINDQIFKNQVRDDINKDKSRGIKTWTLRKIGVKIIEKSMGVVGGTVETVAAIGRNVKKVGDSFRVKMWQWLYKETGLYGVEEVPSGKYAPDVSGNNKKMQGVTSWDPNEKIGPAGYGSGNHIAKAGKMNYQILFENKKEATAPAWRIVIVDTLREELDPETVEFGRTSHPGFTMTRDGNVLTWFIEGIELPPNANPPEGEGWVAFSVNAKSGLSSGAVIKNSATITFDLNKPITTNEVVNTLDTEAPVTVMNKNITMLEGDSLLVKWQASDPGGGAGVSSTTLFRSIDGGSYEAVGVTNADSFILAAEPGSHKYSFYAASTDNVGNSEHSMPEPATAELVTGVSAGNQVPKEFTLAQNYPNPFNPSTTISFTIPAEGKVVLKIYDILGREAAVLINEVMKPGYYSRQWSPQNLASGIYFYSLRLNQKHIVKKMVMVK